MAERISTSRVRGVAQASAAFSQAFATSMLKRHAGGSCGSLPPMMPVCSSLAASKRWA
jgi:hypothetical protein